jgi:eukaryotic-like serine/threonine-protein kinase
MDHGEGVAARTTCRGRAVTPERWQQIKAVFQSCCERPPAERDSWLAESTANDPDLKREVARMLRHAEGSGILDTPAWQGLRLESELGAGDHLGPYEVLSEIGVGGMGRVYKARDTRLGRIVAIKVLNAEFSHRLKLEGQAVCALNHPHVCALYDIGEQAGAAYLVMEYIEGQSLAACLTAGALPIDTVLRYGAEIAGALSAAHAQGIVHRDLKPANIMVTASGVKVLDFGVARRVGDDGPAGGAVAGTAAYMSPSQWNGTPADTRSDIYALGLVLCEMATGARPSRDWRRQLPSAFADLIERCLQEDAGRRFQSMDEVRAALERSRSRLARTPSRRVRTVGAAAALATAVAVAALYPGKLPDLPHPPAVRIPSPAVSPTPPPHREEAQPTKPRVFWQRAPIPEPPSVGILASYPGMERDPSFSPDGTKVAFAWEPNGQRGFAICVRNVQSDEAPIAVTNGAHEDWGPAWSPDGRTIAFRRRRGDDGIYRVKATGGPETRLASIGKVDQETLPQMSWSRDGRWIAAPDRDAYGVTHINLIAAASGEKRELTANPFGMDHAPAFSPDGKSLAYASCRKGASNCDVYIIDFGRGLQAKPRRQITQQDLYLRGIAWAPDGRDVVYSAGLTRSANTSLYRVPADTPGNPARIDLAGSDARHPTVSGKSMLAYTSLNSWNLMMIRNFR